MQHFRKDARFGIESSQRGREGFALIITLTLMAFVVLLLLSLLVFSRVETTTSSNHLHKNQARENARMALNIALSELQQAAGEDQRVTAQARLIDPDFLATGAGAFDPQQLYTITPSGNPLIPAAGTGNNLRGAFDHPFWTGVWDPTTGTDPLNPSNWRWLVSGNENLPSPQDQGTNNYPNSRLPYDANNPSNRPERDSDTLRPVNEEHQAWITLVGGGSTTRNAADIENWLTPDPYVYARAQDIYSDVPGIPDRRRIGRYAYWVGDEGVKASLNAAAHHRLTDDTNRDRQNQAANFLTASRFGFEYFSDIEDSNPASWDTRNPDTENWVDSTDPRWARLRMLRQATMFNGMDLNEDLRGNYHSLTAHSRGVLANSNPDPNPTPGLKRDLTRNPDHTDLPPAIQAALPDYLDLGRWIVSDHSEAPAPNDTPPMIEPDHDNAEVGDFPFPLRYYENIDDGQLLLRPIVKDVRIRGSVETDGEGAAFVMRLVPEIQVWNPYNVDLTYFDDNGNQTGYQFILRLTNLVDEGDPFWLGVGAGIHWKDESEPEEDQEPDEYVSWIPDEPLDLFGEHGSSNAEGNPFIQFESNEIIRLRAGDVYLLSGDSLEFGPVDVSWPDPTDDDWEEDFSLEFDPRGTRGDDWEIEETIGTLFAFIENLEDLAPLELSVYALPSDHSPGTMDDNEFLLFRRLIDAADLEALDLLPDPTLQDDPEPVVEDGHSYGNDDGQWRLDWTDSEVQPYASAVRPDYNLGESARFAISLAINNPMSTNQNFVAAFDPRDPDEMGFVPGNFYGRPSNFEDGWGSGEGHPEDRYGGLSDFADAAERRGVVLFDIPNDLSEFYDSTPGNANRRGAVTSIGQLQHLYFDGADRLFMIGDDPGMHGGSAAATTTMNELLWDSFYFSTLFSTTGDPDQFTNLTDMEFLNPRMSLYSGGLDRTEIQNNLAETGVSDRAAENLLVTGSFNVNSVSVEAWTNLLHGFFEENLTYVYWDSVDFEERQLPGRIWERDGGNIPGDLTDVPYPRFSHAPGAGFFGRLPYDGIADRRSIWRNGFRELYPLDLSAPINNAREEQNRWAITPTNPMVDLAQNDADPDGRLVEHLEGRGLFAEEMARIIVAEIRDRVDNNEPFTTVADFVNSGILQTAIDDVPWRIILGAGDEPPIAPALAQQVGLNMYYDEDEDDWFDIPRSSPSFLSQRDILARIGPFLTARSDTFVIRTFGEARNPATDEVEAVAYCEAIVQRVPQPWISGQDTINPTNGRKFEIVSFRWLDPDEI